jgi:ribosome recycling factor
MALFRTARALRPLSYRGFASERPDRVPYEDLIETTIRTAKAEMTRAVGRLEDAVSKMHTEEISPSAFEDLFVPFLLASVGTLGEFTQSSKLEIVFEPHNAMDTDRILYALDNCNQNVIVSLNRRRTITITAPDLSMDFKVKARKQANQLAFVAEKEVETQKNSVLRAIKASPHLTSSLREGLIEEVVAMAESRAEKIASILEDTEAKIMQQVPQPEY